MQRWRIEGKLDGELVGRVEPISESGDDVTGEITAVFEQPPEWEEFWSDELDHADGEIDGESPFPIGRPEFGPSPRRLWTWAFVIAAVGLVARAAWYLRFGDEWFWRLGPDGQTYFMQAVGYLRGAIGDPEAGPLPWLYREVFPPGYPLFLTAIMRPFSDLAVRAQGDDLLLTIRVVQWLLAAGVTLMTFALARRVLFGYTTLLPPALLTASIALVDMPNLIAYETLLMFLLTASLLLLVKTGEGGGSHRRLYAVTAGAAFGYAALTQPRVLVALPFAAAWLARAAPARFTIVFTLLALIVPGAWVARDHLLFDEIVPISINGQVSVYLDNVDPIGGAGFVMRAAPPECPRAALVEGPIEDRFEWATCMRDAGLRQITDHPERAARAMPDRLAALISPWNETWARGTYAAPDWDYHSLVPAATRASPTFKSLDRAGLYAWLAIYAALILLGVFALWAEGPGSAARLIALPLLTMPLIHLVFHAENRFRVPLLPLIVIALTLGALAATEALRRPRR